MLRLYDTIGSLITTANMHSRSCSQWSKSLNYIVTIGMCCVDLNVFDVSNVMYML